MVCGTVAKTWVFSNETNAIHRPTQHFYPLQTKCRPLYSKTHSVPRCKHFSSRL